VEPSEKPQRCETFNANCVLISKGVMDQLGGLDDSFTHYFGDYDLGLRASRAGIPIWIAPGYIGICNSNPIIPKARSLGDRWRALTSPKGYRPLEHLRFSRRHGGHFWPVFWAAAMMKRLWPYGKNVENWGKV
jgi:GT2 family glycosyltransferase